MAKRRRPKSAPSLPSLVSLAAPPEAQLRNATAMAANWADPADDKPTAARTARQVHGWRTYDPLRKCHGHPGTSVTREHISAADAFRLLADGACIGFSAGRDNFLPISSIRYRPMTGPGATALRQERCWRKFATVLRLFDADQTLLLVHVLLLNWTVRRWCQARREAGLTVSPDKEMCRLLECLDRLVEHFETDIARHGAAVI